MQTEPMSQHPFVPTDFWHHALPHLSLTDQVRLQAWCVQPADWPETWTIVQWFEDQVRQTPQALALIEGATQLTYTELNQRANQLAHYLHGLNVQPGELVAVSMARSVDLIVAFWGILKAGAAYVPLDPTYPHERRAYKLKDAQVRVILTQAELLTTLPEHQARVVVVDHDWPTIARQSTMNPGYCTDPESLAYVLYTSGSTGNPKGVMVKHRGVVNHAAAISREFALKPGDRMLQFSNIGFDIIVEELYPTMVTGATLVLRPEEIASSMRSFLEFIIAQEITILELPTAFWHELVNSLVTFKQMLPEMVRLVCVGGEKASRTAYQQWRKQVHPAVRWINTYGPTETTVSATWFDPLKEGYDPELGEIPIGKPLPNVEVYVLDEKQQPVAIGATGELCIGGPGVAQGYLNLPDRTQERFIQIPGRSTRLYRTGDQVRFRQDGHLEFMGRIDFQVKIRGFRIELTEIEAKLEAHPQLRQAVVMAQERAGTKYLVGYVVPVMGAALSPKNLGSWLQDKLPNYMIPSQWVLLENLPLTPNGKVDRKALPEPNFSSRQATEFDPPQDWLERELVQLWEELLGQPVGVQDNFFELGGHSLLVARLCDRMATQLHYQISPTALFQAPTVRQLGQYLKQSSTQPRSALDSAIVIQPGAETKPALFAIHVLGEGGRFFRPLAKYLGVEQPVYGLAAQMMDNDNAPNNRVEDLAAYYIRQMQTIQPEGPYYLVGMSYGGSVAYEMARQMEQMGLEIGMIGLLDTYGPQSEALPSRERLGAHWRSLKQQGGVYIGDKVKQMGKSRIERLRVRYARIAQKLGRPVSYELRYKIILSDNLKASNAYRPQFYAGRLSLFRATDAIFYPQSYLEAGLGWRDLVGQLDIYDVPGDHMTMVEAPHAAVLAQQMRQAMLGGTRGATIGQIPTFTPSLNA
jgi:amino acid adenylation domain-containing protein